MASFVLALVALRSAFALPPASFDLEGARRAFPAFSIGLEDRANERKRAFVCAERVLSRYPAGTVSEVYVVRSLGYKGAACGGLASPDGRSVVLALGRRFEPSIFKANLHHELAHALMFRRRASFPRVEWLADNADGFRYDGGGLGAIQSGKASMTLSPALAERGVPNEYAASSMDEDWACCAEAVATGDRKFRTMAERYPRLREKARITAAFLRLAGVKLPNDART